jgi:hypothetical protein
VGNWDDAVRVMNSGIQLEFLRLVILCVREFYELTGSWPTAAQLRAKINQPGS